MISGVECLTILNDIITSFDKLLFQKQFSRVEKIKVISSTYMAACGLQPGRKASGGWNTDLYGGSVDDGIGGDHFGRSSRNSATLGLRSNKGKCGPPQPYDFLSWMQS